MLSVKNLVKEYNAKNGQTVRALDGVSIDFPDSGMVFLLGKSGSGKSTLLNVAGGLDTPSDGEIIIDGKSSKDFSVTDFDGYRNSCVGFVFQEFNILNEFSVGQNVALALQLQNRYDDQKAVKKILEEVGLDDTEDRGPNTLSGGQKQRVAIARALIKDPKIIMADEPTGALDSQTGRQILETLKKLSENRLVVVVTHDREFAENYGDRIIELKDGKVVSDLSKSQGTNTFKENVSFVSDDTVCVNDWEKVTDQELSKIVSVLKKSKGQTVITSRKNIEDGKTDFLKEDGTASKFVETKEQRVEQKSGENIKFIKSTLPLKNALKMAFGSLKTKPVRLAITILLSIIAFTFFGVAATFMLYDPDYSVATALENSDYDSIVLEKRYDASFTATELSEDGKTFVENQYEVALRAGYTKEELAKLNDNKKGIKFAGIMDLGSYKNYQDSVLGYESEDRFALRGVVVDKEVASYYQTLSLCGFSDCGNDFLLDNGFTLLAGEYPENYNEIAVSEYVYQIYKNLNREDNSSVKEYPTPKNFIGEYINVGGNTFKVTAVYDVGDIPEKFDVLLNGGGQLDSYGLSKLKSQMKDTIALSYHTVGFVSSDFYDKYANINLSISTRLLQGMVVDDSSPSGYIDQNRRTAVYTKSSIWQYEKFVRFFDKDGKPIEYSLQNDQAYFPASQIMINAGAFLEAVITVNDSGYEDFIDAYERYRNDKHSEEDYALILNTLIKDDKLVLGYEIDDKEVIYAKTGSSKLMELEVVGYYGITEGKNRNSEYYFVTDEFCDKNTISEDKGRQYKTDYQFNVEQERYGRLIVSTDNERSKTLYILKSAGKTYSNAMRNNIYTDAYETADAIDDMKVAFYAAGGVFGVFAILMLFNFISVTVATKKKEIGILRAIGARKIDVFKIFFIEALIITLSCFMISVGLSGIACSVINGYLIKSALGVSALNFGVLSILLLFVTTLAVSLIATVFPVKKAAGKPPVESIRAI